MSKLTYHMRLSTRLAHSYLRMKHSFLKLRVHRPAYYQFLIAVMLIAAVGGLVAGYFFFIRDNSSTTQANDILVIKTYSLNGQISKVSENSFQLKASSVQIIEGVGTVIYQIKTINLKSETQLRLIKLANSSSIVAQKSDLKVGQNVVIYTSDNPSDTSIITAENIEIIQ
jgi:hypothetical protein